jgi:hypothetical protein
MAPRKADVQRVSESRLMKRPYVKFHEISWQNRTEISWLNRTANVFQQCKLNQ